MKVLSDKHLVFLFFFNQRSKLFIWFCIFKARLEAEMVVQKAEEEKRLINEVVLMLYSS